ncbi:MAG: glutamate synthase subunit beta [Flavobacteriales bacterium]|jgi:glutamate synthase (NADPH/NADH) small chain|tara:strand:+ start:1771 stop:3201 length:1431 start_codon:yes stop_codon:yes gene_type:complete
MGKVTGFLELDRQDQTYIAASERISNFKEFSVPLREETLREQASRCMDCGIPFCHDMKGLKGCPVNNQIPDWNNLVYEGDWQAASENLHSTNNFPEVTGRICPAPCEASCTLNLIESPVTIKSIECAIVDKAWENGWIMPQVPAHKTGKKIAIIGSGPAGMAAAQQLARAGHDVNLYEKNQKIGGLMRYGIPDFKMEKVHIDRRVIQMTAEGVTFHLGVKVGDDVALGNLVDQHDAVILSGGAERPRDLPIKGRNLKGVHFAMEFLPQQNRRVSNEAEDAELILAKDRHVVVIGGGDTGSDCIGTSIRQGALSVTQLEIMPPPPEQENKLLTWPNWPVKMRTSSSQEEGADREFAAMTQYFEGENDQLKALHCIRVDEKFQPIPESEFVLRADIALLAMGFVSPVTEGMITDFGIELDDRQNVHADTFSYRTNHDKVWSAGDMRRGQSLVVWAIREGRQCAHAVDKALMGTTTLPR